MAATDPFGPSNTELTKLNDQLDSIWIEYLDLLDSYTKAQSAIQESFSAGFFSLAQANTRASSGRRFGQDWYDGRMKATRRVAIEPSSTENESKAIPGGQSLRIVRTYDEGGFSRKDEQPPVSAEKEATQQLSPPATPEPEPGSTKSPDTAAAEAETSARDTIWTPNDPLRWFGILVPPELRRAQKAFSAVLEEHRAADGKMTDEQGDLEVERRELDPSSLVRAIIAAGRMRELEMEIRKVRKAVRKLEKRIVEAA